MEGEVMQNQMEGLDLKGSGNNYIMNMTNIDLGKGPGKNDKTNGDTNDIKTYGKSEKSSVEKEVDETQEPTQENIAKISEGSNNDECDAIHIKGPCPIQNDDSKEEPKFNAGDTLLRSKPFAFIIEASHRSHICEECWCPMSGGGLAWCNECGLVRYCGEVCRMRGWEEHKLECTMIGQEGAGGRVLNDQLRLVARIWLKIRAGTNMAENQGEITRTWDDLMDHAEEMEKEKEELLNSQYNLLGAVVKKQNMPDRKTFVSIYGKMLVNFFSLRSDRSFSPEPFGIGIYLLGSIFNHSCIPNCTVGFLGRDLLVTATEGIMTGELSTVSFISYVNTMDDTKTRNEKLRENWFFTCQCTLCLDSSADKSKHCMKCPKCGADRPVDILEWSMPPNCRACKKSSAKEDKKQLDRYREHYLLLTEKGGMEMSDMSYDYLSAWCAKEMDGVFGAMDILYLQTVHYVHSICMSNHLWPAAVVYGEIALPAFRIYYGERSKVVAALLVSLGEAFGKEGMLKKSANCFRDADCIYKVIPGISHPFYTQDFMPLYNKYVCIARAVVEFAQY